ncbi:hypothetical protein [Brevibacterium oceani]|uniref:hypothetical protein n=1 Tax=Brevibacterium oceani TaxID=358099 RepID=UPI0015E6D447|nr:hypothetical protein [Brevibacterium oceani]
MSYGQSSHSNGPWQSQPAAGSPTYPSPPPHAPAPREAQESQHPGWLARSLFWAALIIGMLPALVLTPLATTGGTSAVVLFSLGSIICACLRLILGTATILLVKNTSWARRLIGAGIFFLGCAALLILTPLTGIILSAGTEAGGSMLTLNIIQGVLNAFFLAAVFCGWNIARNRRWWILVIAVALGSVLAVLNMTVAEPLAENVTTGVMAGVLVQSVWLVLVFACLGLFHLLGRNRGATVPSASRIAP